MDNASKNAKDMIGSLRMKYNRGRQAAITNELVNIITGKSYDSFKFSTSQLFFLFFFYRRQCSLTHSYVQLRYYRCLSHALV